MFFEQPVGKRDLFVGDLLPELRFERLGIDLVHALVLLRNDDVDAVASRHALVEPAELLSELFGRHPPRAQDTHSAIVADRGDDIAAMGEREDRVIHAEFPAQFGNHRLEPGFRRCSIAGGCVRHAVLSLLVAGIDAAIAQQLCSFQDAVFHPPGACGGWLNARMDGSSPSKRSTSTRQLCAVGPCARRDVPTSRVRTLGLPCTSSAPISPGGSGSYHAPVGNSMTPGRIASESSMPARHAPRSL